MKYPVIDPRTEEELLAEIEKKAKDYTPEWRLDRENPDAGTALAMVFARFRHRTLGQLNKVLYKNQIEFYNRLHASMRPSEPAAGFVTFGLVNDSVSGILLPKGTALTTAAEGKGGEKVSAETMEDVFVTPVPIGKIFESSSRPDYIGKLYDQDEEESRSFSLFGFGEENLTGHEFAFSHPSLFSIRRTGRIVLRFFGRGGEPVSREVLSRLAERENAVFEYSAGEGFEPLLAQSGADGEIVLEKRSSQPPAAEQELGGRQGVWIRLRLFSYEAAEEFAFEDMRLLGSGPVMAPDYVEADGVDQGSGLCLPFGERPGIYSEVYFASGETLSKKGAWVTFSFREAFLKVPLNEKNGDGIQWKLIMPRSSVPVEREYDISVREVAWEYYNGRGWVRLFKGKEYSDIFGVENGTANRKRTMVFQCPEDLEPASVGAAETCYIRARILKMDNAFKIEGQYVAPVISELSFSYEYPEPGERPEYFYCKNAMREQLFPSAVFLDRPTAWSPFHQNGDLVPTVYVGFGGRISEGPVRMLWTVDNMGPARKPALLWEYDSGGRWRELNVADGTENFRRTGLVTFQGNPDWAERTMFGERLYWLRIRDVSGAYGPGKENARPVIGRIFMNAVRARTVRSGYEEYATLDPYIENFSHRLLYSNIHSLEVWVDETETCPREEREALRREGRLREVFDRSGMLTEVWVRWEQTESFSGSDKASRHYLLDANEGILSFGDNRRGRIPAVGIPNGIHLLYSVGGGEETNLRPGEITGLDQSAGFISRAENPLAFSGGYGRESAADAALRRAGELKHRFRAVTARDFERLALEASGDIAKVRCLSGFDEEGNPENGHVSLVILKRDYEAGSHFFPELRERILSYLRDKADPNLFLEGRLHVLEPVRVKIGVQADLYILDHESAYEIKSEAVGRLSEFLNPVSGNQDRRGFSIGELPRREQIMNAVRQDDRIRYIGNMMITYTVLIKERETEVSLSQLLKNPYILPENGSHTIMLRWE